MQKNQKSRKSLNMRDGKRVVASRGIRLSKTLITGIRTPKFPAEAEGLKEKIKINFHLQPIDDSK